MRLYLMRHGLAVQATPTRDDFQRSLTEEGIRETRMMAAHLARIATAPLGIYVSPLLRTQQTASIVAEEWRRQNPQIPLSSASLYALTRPAWEPLADFLLNVQAVQRIQQACLITHQPFLEKWLTELTGTVLQFRQSAIAIIDYQFNGRSRLTAYLTPDLREGL